MTKYLPGYFYSCTPRDRQRIVSREASGVFPAEPVLRHPAAENPSRTIGGLIPVEPPRTTGRESPAAAMVSPATVAHALPLPDSSSRATAARKVPPPVRAGDRTQVRSGRPLALEQKRHVSARPMTRANPTERKGSEPAEGPGDSECDRLEVPSARESPPNSRRRRESCGRISRAV